MSPGSSQVTSIDSRLVISGSDVEYRTDSIEINITSQAQLPSSPPERGGSGMLPSTRIIQDRTGDQTWVHRGSSYALLDELDTVLAGRVEYLRHTDICIAHGHTGFVVQQRGMLQNGYHTSSSRLRALIT